MHARRERDERHTRSIRRAGEVDTEKLRRWLAEARVVQWDYRNLVRRKGRLQRLK